jgi:hypothetical protein
MSAISRFSYALFALVGTLCVLGGLLLPGYILTLDAVFGPVAIAPSFSGLAAASAPVRELFVLLVAIFPAWLVQKAYLVAIIFSLCYLPLRFFPFAREHGAEYASAILFAVNPFVYERFLAGQWGIVLAAAFLFPLVSLLLELVRGAPVHLRFAALWLVLIAMFSLHIFVIAALSTLVALAIAAFRADARLLVREIVAAAVIVLALSSYWLMGAYSSASAQLAHFDDAHREAFMTHTDPALGTIGTVATLYGFWGEDDPWAEQFRWPAEYPMLSIIGLVMLAFTIGLGVYSLCTKAYCDDLALLLVLGAGAIVFSCGIAPGPFAALNAWLFEHVPVWDGFRDSEKWSALLLVVYAILWGRGVAVALSAVREYARPYLLGVLLTVPLFYVPTMVPGFLGQLKPLWYPDSWQQVDAILSQDPACSAVFLPWHQYYSARFADGRLIGNPASKYFHCQMYVSHDPEIGTIDAIGESALYYRINAILTAPHAQADLAIADLKASGIRYIILSRDLEGEDPLTYSFIMSQNVQVDLNTPGVVLLRLL